MSRGFMPKGVLCAESCLPARPTPLHRLLVWITDTRSHRVVCLVAALWVLSAFDLFLTIMASQQGLLHELNPVAAKLLADGDTFLVLYKFGLLALASYPLLKFRRERIVELGALLVLVVYAMLAVHWQACYDVYAQTGITMENRAWLDPNTSLRSSPFRPEP